MTKRVVYRKFFFVRPHVVHRTPADAARVWRARLPKYRAMAVVWALVTALWARTDGPTDAATLVSGVACLLTAAVCVKALVIIRRGERGGRATSGG